MLDQISGKDVGVIAIGSVARVSTRGDEASGVGADVPEADDEAGGNLSIDGEIVVDGGGAAKVGVDAADADLAADDAAFRIKRLATEGRVWVAERIGVLGSVAEDGRSR